MRSRAGSIPLRGNSNLLHEMVEDLHDLCQPITALQFHLETARLSGEHEVLKLAIDGSLIETRRIFAVIAQMRSHLMREETSATVSAV